MLLTWGPKLCCSDDIKSFKIHTRYGTLISKREMQGFLRREANFPGEFKTDLSGFQDNQVLVNANGTIKGFRVGSFNFEFNQTINFQDYQNAKKLTNDWSQCKAQMLTEIAKNHLKISLLELPYKRYHEDYLDEFSPIFTNTDCECRQTSVWETERYRLYNCCVALFNYQIDGRYLSTQGNIVVPNILHELYANGIDFVAEIDYSNGPTIYVTYKEIYLPSLSQWSCQISSHRVKEDYIKLGRGKVYFHTNITLAEEVRVKKGEKLS